MKNIGIIRFNSGDYGGIEHQIINIVSNLNSEDYKFVLITNQETQFSSVFKEYGEVYYIDSENIWKASKQVKKIVEEQSINIIQSHMLKEHYIGCLTKFRTKNLYHIFRVHTYINCSFISNLKKKLYHLLSFLLSSKVDLYLPINEVNKIELMKNSRINEKKIEVVHNGVKALEIIEKNDSFNKTNIAMIANLNYGKGHDIAIRALQLLVKEDKSYHMSFIGYEKTKSPDGTSITEKVKELSKELQVDNNISLLGYIERDNIGEIINNIDIIILPSYSEGTPNCLLEAMSVKKIVIASAVGGIPEFIKDGENGFLHENKNYEELAKKIMDLRNLSKEKLDTIRENGYKTWKDEYTVERLCDYLDSLYKKIVVQ